MKLYSQIVVAVFKILTAWEPECVSLSVFIYGRERQHAERADLSNPIFPCSVGRMLAEPRTIEIETFLKHIIKYPSPACVLDDLIFPTFSPYFQTYQPS